MSYNVTNVNPTRFHRNQLRIFAYLVPLSVFMLLPIVFIINHAFKPLGELFAFPPKFFVTNPTWKNFEQLFQATENSDIHISRYFFNSLLVTVVVVLLTILISSMGGYALSKMNFRGKKVLLEVNNIALMFVPVSVAIPRYLIIQWLHISNSYLAHILPLLVMPVCLFLVKQFVDEIPDSLTEAATVDGASEWTIYRKIILPLAKPALATTALLTFQSVWNNTETSIMYVNSESMKTLAYYLSTLASNSNIVASQGIAAAQSLIMFIPNMVLFIIMQSRVMNTMATSGMK